MNVNEPSNTTPVTREEFDALTKLVGSLCEMDRHLFEMIRHLAETDRSTVSVIKALTDKLLSLAGPKSDGEAA